MSAVRTTVRAHIDATPLLSTTNVSAILCDKSDKFSSVDLLKCFLFHRKL